VAARSLSAALRRIRGRADGQAAEQQPSVDAIGKTLDPFEQQVVEHTLKISITSRPRILAVIDAVRYCVRAGIPGGFAECGVWRGGSIVAMIMTLQELGVSDRDIYLYDTFEGMTPPTEADTSPIDPPALETWKEAEEGGHRAWEYYFEEDVFNEDMVRENVLSTGYPEERVHFVRGKVEDTLPEHAPDQLGLLRLDTDWYESTRHELVHLYPKLTAGGVLIIDDYGHWDGSRRAVDEYFEREADPILLSRIDYTGRVGIKR
jgi:O-methyltransferase